MSDVKNLNGIHLKIILSSILNTIIKSEGNNRPQLNQKIKLQSNETYILRYVKRTIVVAQASTLNGSYSFGRVQNKAEVRVGIQAIYI